MSDLTVTFIQTSLVWEDIQANLDHFDQLLAGLTNPGDLVVLPETFTTGFSMNPAPLAQSMDGDTVRWMLAKAFDLQCDIAGSIIIQDQGGYYNRLIWARPDGSCLHYDKRHRFRMTGEHAAYDAGQQLLTVTLKGWRVRPFICYDLRFPIWTRNLNNAYDLALFTANWPAKRASHWRALLRARAIENLSYVIGVNRVGHDGNGLDYQGDSCVITPTGEVVFERSSTPCMHTANLSRSLLDQWRCDFPAWKDADTELILAEKMQ